MRLPTKQDVEITIKGLNLPERDADDLRAFYEVEHRKEARKRALWTAWRVLKGVLMVIGVIAILLFCAVLWMLPGGLP